jgi:GDPmannose 4,6-dehydratase
VNVTSIALVTGIAGQDGYYLSHLLRTKGYEVHGLLRPGKRVSPELCHRIHEADISQPEVMDRIVGAVRPDEVYNLAGFSRVSVSFEDPISCATANGLGTIRILEAIRRHRDRTGRAVRFYQASSSEMFGSIGATPRNEQTPFDPQSPYACSKVFAHLQTINHRTGYGLYACCGILFNHESPRRPEHFVTRKITAGAARIKLGLADRLSLGNVDVRRDWGFAGDYVEAMWLMLQQEQPDDYVIATGQTHSVREFGQEVFSHFELDWEKYVNFDPGLARPADVLGSCGDASKAQRVLGWRPRVDFRALARMMADEDLRLASKERR